MEVGTALLAVVLCRNAWGREPGKVRNKLTLGRDDGGRTVWRFLFSWDSDAGSVLPNVACVALDHHVVRLCSKRNGRGNEVEVQEQGEQSKSRFQPRYGVGS